MENAAKGYHVRENICTTQKESSFFFFFKCLASLGRDERSEKCRAVLGQGTRRMAVSEWDWWAIKKM